MQVSSNPLLTDQLYLMCQITRTWLLLNYSYHLILNPGLYEITHLQFVLNHQRMRCEATVTSVVSRAITLIAAPMLFVDDTEGGGIRKTVVRNLSRIVILDQLLATLHLTYSRRIDPP